VRSFKNLLSRTTGSISTNLGTNILGGGGQSSNLLKSTHTKGT
jgi:hypothetical protein